MEGKEVLRQLQDELNGSNARQVRYRRGSNSQFQPPRALSRILCEMGAFAE